MTDIKKTKKIVTSALPYVNNQPHLGNVIGSVLSGDVYARFCKKNNEDAIYLSGTDEYGTAIEMAAFAQNKTPQEICEENRVIHKQIYDWFNINFDYFGRTTTEEHTRRVQEAFKKIYANGYFAENEIEQFFCDNCSIFLADRYVVGTCLYCGFGEAKGDQCDSCGHTYKSLDLINAKCTLCSLEPSKKFTKHLFFDFDKFREPLTNLFDANSHTWSNNAKQITKAWLDQDLLPRCMTRDLKNLWGVPVPLEGFESKVFYVWFDAVLGYFTFLREWIESKNDKSQVDQIHAEWLDQGELYQFMGKDNVFFHSLVLPSLIFATGDKLPLLKKLSATEFLQYENDKFSKSRGHGIFGLDLVDNSLGESCLWRYYLLKIRPEKCDSNFSFTHFQTVIETDLNNTIGNFCNRVLKYIHSKLNRKVKVDLESLGDREKNTIDKLNAVFSKYLTHFEAIKIKDALENVQEIAKIGNEYVQQVIDSKKDVSEGFQFAFSIVVFLGNVLEPFIPVTSAKLYDLCNVKNENFSKSFTVIKENTISENITNLFTKLDDETLKKLESFRK